MPTGERASGSQEQPTYDANPESFHEPKGNPSRPANKQREPTVNKGPAKVRKDMFKDTQAPKANAQAKATPKPKTNPKHDTDKNDNPDP